MPISKKLKWRHALSQLRFCNDELEYTIESANAAAPDFEAFYRKFCAQNNINISELDNANKERLKKLYGNQKITDGNTDQQAIPESSGDCAIVVHNNPHLQASEKYQMNADDIAMHDAFSKLFKQIALKLHPDRISNFLPSDEVQMRINMFQTVNQAFEDKKYYVLLDCADKYNISSPKNYDQQVRWMKKETQKIVELVDSQKNTYNYAFSQSQTDEEREALVKKFIFQLFRVIV